MINILLQKLPKIIKATNKLFRIPFLKPKHTISLEYSSTVIFYPQLPGSTQNLSDPGICSPKLSMITAHLVKIVSGQSELSWHKMRSSGLITNRISSQMIVVIDSSTISFSSFVSSVSYGSHSVSPSQIVSSSNASSSVSYTGA